MKDYINGKEVDETEFDFGNMFPEFCPICKNKEVRFNGYDRKKEEIIWKCCKNLSHVFNTKIENPGDKLNGI